MSPIIEREEKTMQYHVAWDKDNERGWFEVYDDESGGEDYYGERKHSCIWCIPLWRCCMNSS